MVKVFVQLQLLICGLKVPTVHCLVWINKDFVLREVLARAVPFNNAPHTAENICAEAQKLLLSLTISLDDVFARVCDRGSYMKKVLGSCSAVLILWSDLSLNSLCTRCEGDDCKNEGGHLLLPSPCQRC